MAAWIPRFAARRTNPSDTAAAIGRRLIPNLAGWKPVNFAKSRGEELRLKGVQLDELVSIVQSRS
jgi:hypothetical protein